MTQRRVFFRGRAATYVVLFSAIALILLVGVLLRSSPPPSPQGQPPQTAVQPESAPPVVPPPVGAPTAPTAAPPSPAPSAAPGGAGAVGSSTTATPSEVPHPDLPPDHPPISTEDRAQISIQWLGWSCFYIHSPGGQTVVTDPFDPGVTGYPRPDTGAHVVTVSARNEPAANFTEAIHAFEGSERRALIGGTARQGDLRITSVSLGRERFGYIIDAGAMRVVHLGGLTEDLSPDTVKALGKVDILLVPAGGVGVKPAVAARAVGQIAPRLVIPMAYDDGFAGLKLKAAPLEEFLKGTPYAVTRKDSDVTMIGMNELPGKTELLTLQLRR